MKKIIFLLFLLLISLVNAQNVNVVKDAPSTINLQDILNVDISINNPENIKKSYEIIEIIPQGFSLIQPSQPDEIEQRDALSIMLYRWKTDIQPQKIFTINYKIKPNEVGEYTIPPTKVIDLSNNNIYLSEPKQVLVLCRSNNLCEENENSVNCPEDCKGGLKDGICEYKADGICDPDCEEEPDCKKTSQTIYILIIAILSVIVITIFLINKIKKSKKNLNFTDVNNKKFNETIKYVKLFRERGYSDEQIRQKFLEKGWSNEDLDEIFRSL